MVNYFLGGLPPRPGSVGGQSCGLPPLSRQAGASPRRPLLCASYLSAYRFHRCPVGWPSTRLFRYIKTNRWVKCVTGQGWQRYRPDSVAGGRYKRTARRATSARPPKNNHHCSVRSRCVAKNRESEALSKLCRRLAFPGCCPQSAAARALFHHYHLTGLAFATVHQGIGVYPCGEVVAIEPNFVVSLGKLLAYQEHLAAG